MKNQFGCKYFQWFYGPLFNEGGKYFTFQIHWHWNVQFLFRIWASSAKILKRELDFTIDIRKVDKEE